MELLILCPQWGHEHLPFEEFCEKVKAAGYDGIETWLPLEKSERHTMARCLERHQLFFVSHQHQAAGENINAFCRSYNEWLHISSECAPLFINSHSGRDFFSFDDKLKILDTAAAFSAKTGIDVAHETHRGRLFYCPADADQLLSARPQTKLTADFSHWVCVSESLHLEGFKDILQTAINLSHHIHCRVGFAEGPQIPDPRSLFWQKEVDVFLYWWRAIAHCQKNNGKRWLTMTPEFGPPPYLWTDPSSNKPIANQWEINRYIKDLLRQQLAPELRNENQPD